MAVDGIGKAAAHILSIVDDVLDLAQGRGGGDATRTWSSSTFER